MTGGDSRDTHLGFLDSIRGVAALYVVLHHAASHVPAELLKINGLTKLLLTTLLFGHYAVDTFIVLSGYCLMLPVLRNQGRLEIGKFFWRRAWRILPPYYASALLSWLAIATIIGQPTGTHWDLAIPVQSRDLWTHLLVIHEWFPASAAKISHVYWSIGVEWKIYFMFPLLCWLWYRIGPTRTTVLAVVVSFAVWVFIDRLDIMNPGPWGSSPYYLGLFAMGMLAATYAQVSKHTTRHALNWVLLTLSVAVLAVSFPRRLGFSSPPLQWRSLLVGAWSATLLLALHRQTVPRLLQRLVMLAPLRFLGKIGYSLYLIHAPLIQLVYLFVFVPFGLQASSWSVLVMTLLSGIVSVSVASVFYVCVERPFHLISRGTHPWLRWIGPLLAPSRLRRAAI